MNKVVSFCLLLFVLLIPVATYFATDFFYSLLGLSSDVLKDAVNLAVTISAVVAGFVVGYIHERDKNSIIIQPNEDSFNVIVNVKTANIEKARIKILHSTQSTANKQIFSWDYNKE